MILHDTECGARGCTLPAAFTIHRSGTKIRRFPSVYDSKLTGTVSRGTIDMTHPPLCYYHDKVSKGLISGDTTALMRDVKGAKLNELQ